MMRSGGTYANATACQSDHTITTAAGCRHQNTFCPRPPPPPAKSAKEDLLPCNKIAGTRNVVNLNTLLSNALCQGFSGNLLSDFYSSHPRGIEPSPTADQQLFVCAARFLRVSFTSRSGFLIGASKLFLAAYIDAKRWCRR